MRMETGALYFDRELLWFPGRSVIMQAEVLMSPLAKLTRTPPPTDHVKNSLLEPKKELWCSWLTSGVGMYAPAEPP